MSLATHQPKPIVGLNANDVTNAEMLRNLQGNILKGHGRHHTNHIFLTFNLGRKKDAKNWLKELGENNITSCLKQLNENELYKRNMVSGGTFFGIYLTAACYTYLGYDATKFEDASYKNGMKAAELNDPEVKLWEKGFTNHIHAMLLIADASTQTLGELTSDIIKRVKVVATINNIEYGNAIFNANDDGIEHFGYVDGISQPLFFKDEIEKYRKNNQPLIYDPAASEDLVLVNDPFVQDKDAFGSYFVFRKLEQNVKGFKEAEEELAQKQLKIKDEKEQEIAGAYLVGRFEDGTPVTLSKEDGLIGSGTINNFNYDTDAGAKCPHLAHIRKTNPRREAQNDKQHVMARRGIPYGLRNVPTQVEELEPLQMPTGDVGLLFMSFQASIIDQFEFIQKMWANDDAFEQNGTGIDPIIGQDRKTNTTHGQLPTIYGDSSSMVPISFKSFVTMKGGEYFFAPSIPFLTSLK